MREFILIFCVSILFCLSQGIAAEDVEIKDQEVIPQMLANEDQPDALAVLEGGDNKEVTQLGSVEDHTDNIDVLDHEAANVKSSAERVARTVIYPVPLIYPAPLYYPRPIYGGFRRRGYGGFYGRRRGFYGRRRRRFGFYG